MKLRCLVIATILTSSWLVEAQTVKIEGFQVPVSSGRSVTLTFDGKMSQLDVVGSGAITYDIAGRIDRIGNSAITYDIAGRIDRIGDSAISYDIAGRTDGVRSQLPGGLRLSVRILTK